MKRRSQPQLLLITVTSAALLHRSPDSCRSARAQRRGLPLFQAPVLATTAAHISDDCRLCCIVAHAPQSAVTCGSQVLHFNIHHPAACRSSRSRLHGTAEFVLFQVGPGAMDSCM